MKQAPSVEPTHGRLPFALQLLSILSVTAWFLFLIRRAFRETFNVDDMTNLIKPYLQGTATVVKGCLLFWTGNIRPLGGLFYLTIYNLAGFHHIPFRYAAIALLVINLFLLYAVFRRLNPHPMFAFLGLIFACYNGDLSDMYMSTGTVYDTLGLTFTLLALLCVMRDNQRWLLAAICTVAAVDSKEMGVAIPALILAYELCLRARPRWAAVISTGLVSVIFTLSRLAVHNELSDLPAYKLTVTWARFLDTTTVYLNSLVFRGHLTGAVAVIALLLALALAAALRNRVMLFGWCYYVAALLPLSFATPRGGYALYIPYAGAAIYLAALVFDKRWTRFAPLLAAAGVLAIVGYQYKQQKILATTEPDHPGGMPAVIQVAEGIAKLAPTLPKGAHLLLINDPFENDFELPHSTLRLRYNDPNLVTTKLTWKKSANKIVYPPEPFDKVFLFTSNDVFELPNHQADADNSPEGQPHSYITMYSKFADLSIVKDVLGAEASSRRWVNQDPELVFRVPEGPSHFVMTYTVPPVILAQTKTLDADVWIGDKPTQPIHVAEPGDLTYTAPLPKGAKPGQLVPVRFHVHHAYIASGDGAKLTFQLISAGFVPD